MMGWGLACLFLGSFLTWRWYCCAASALPGVDTLRCWCLPIRGRFILDMHTGSYPENELSIMFWITTNHPLSLLARMPTVDHFCA